MRGGVMRALPILMKAAMVNATLEGRKSQTRRLKGPEEINKCPDEWSLVEQGIPAIFLNESTGDVCYIKPIWLPGDHLWVKETFVPHLCFGEREEQIHYRADGDNCPIDGTKLRNWKPSIFMFRRYSRITSEVISVRFQRLQDISEEDAKAEGFPTTTGYMVKGGPLKWFETLWDAINGERGYGWDSNPWVRAIEFKRVTP